jgi:hypothetical protein
MVERSWWGDRGGIASVKSRIVNLDELDGSLTIETLSAALVESVECAYGCNCCRRLFLTILKLPNLKLASPRRNGDTAAVPNAAWK